MQIIRKINLGKYGLQFESIDIATNEYDTFEECHKEYMAIAKEITDGLTKTKREYFKKLQQKQSLDLEEQKLYDDLKEKLDKTILPPF